MSKYGFGGGGIELPKQDAASQVRPKIEPQVIEKAVQAGSELGFVNREPSTRLKPGPKRREPQDKVSIPGPKRVVDAFRAYCQHRNITLWEGLEQLMVIEKGRGDQG
jgi:hypothetical protein